MSLEKYNEFIDKVWKRSKKPKMHKKGILGVKWESPVCKPNLEDGKYLSYSIDINERGKYILKLSGETS
jgi:hypothetical protein